MVDPRLAKPIAGQSQGIGSGVLATSAPQAEAWGRRERPEIEQVRPGVWAIPVPVRGPIRFVYSYLIVGDQEILLIDPGEHSDEASDAIAAAFSKIGVLEGQLTGIVITHYHYDHWEGADYLAERTGAWIALSAREWSWIERLTAEDTSAEGMLLWFESFGAHREAARQLAQSADYRDTLVYRHPDRLLSDGELLPIAGERLQVIATPGHSAGHICIFDRKREILFSGDHILPGITPHIALNRFGDKDPLTSYLESLDRVALLGEPEILPAHEHRFVGLNARITELRDDIEQRADEVRVLAASNPHLTPWSAAPQLSWSRPWDGFAPQIRRMAVDETAAHFARLGLLQPGK